MRASRPATQPHPLPVRTTVVPGVGMADLRSLLAAGPEGGVEQAWLRGGEGAVAGGQAARWSGAPGSGVAAAARWWAEVCDRLHPSPGSADDPVMAVGADQPVMAFGSFCFDPARSRVSPVLVVPAWTLVHRQGRTRLIQVGPDADAAGADAVLQRLRRPPFSAGAAPVALTERYESLDAQAWAERVGRGVERIAAGELSKVVLARQVTVEADQALRPGDLALRLHTDYPRCWTFLVDHLVGASPEMLVRREEGLVTSRVLAGTIGVGGENPPERLGRALASSSKDLQEHAFAVASVADSLRASCRAVNVPDAPYVLELPNLLHLATDVTAVTEPGTSVLDLLQALHPSAAVCGTPTETARALITELEELDRGRYSGPVGWVDSSGDGAWAIALRCAQLDPAEPRVARLYAGCGIVAGSDPAAEVAESQAKLVPMRRALRATTPLRPGGVPVGAGPGTEPAR